MENYKWVKWGEKDVKENGIKYLNEIKENIKKIKNTKGSERNFKNTILALDYISGNKHNFTNFLEILILLSPDEKIRKISNEVSGDIQIKLQKIIRDKKLYKAILEYTNIFYKKEKLLDSEKLLVEETLKSFQRMGFDLKGEKEKKYKNNLKKLTKLELKFSSNISEYKDFIEIDENDLKDLPDNFKESLVKNKKDKYKISLDYTQMIPFLENSTNNKKKKELSIKFSKKGGEKNLKILKEILNLRKENAKLLGFKNHAEFVLENRMAKKPEVVEKFEFDLVKKMKKKGQKELKELTEFKNKFDNTKNKEIEFYNFSYYAKKFEMEKFNFNEEKLREYFVLEKVREEMFQLFGNLFGINFKKKNIKLWEKSVELFEIYDKKTNEKISDIAFDLFSRDGKHSGAFMTQIFSGFWNLEKEKFNQNGVVVSCNFRKPTKKIPSLLSLSDMETLFHEFGHSLHGALSKTKIPSQFGTSVKWDFVEVPSQLLENWIKDEKFIRKISKHYLTGKKITEKELKSIKEVKDFLKASGNLRQLNLGVLDYIIHTKGSDNPERLYAKLTKENSYRTINKESLFPASFGHLMGYDAGYYSYMWALVMADDIFSEFKKNGIFDKKTGIKYRKEILEVGSSRDELKSVENFLGRKFNNKAFLDKLK